MIENENLKKKHNKEKIMPTHVYAVGPEQSLLEAAALMREKNISCLPVVRGEVAVGILTERDMVRIMLGTDRNLSGYLVRDVMSSRVVTAHEEEDLFDVYSKMCGNRIRHIVITSDRGEIVGVKTFTDLMASLGREYLAEIKTVADVMTRNIITAQPHNLAASALDRMMKYNISCVPVVEAGRPLGIITERDLSRLAVGDPDVLQWSVEKLMSTPVQTIEEDLYAFDAVSMMNALGIRRLVVTDEDGLMTGLITQSDMVATLIKRHANLEFLVRKRTRQLTRKSEELEFSNQQLRHMDQIKSAFLSSVSHELRTPLTSLLGFAKITGKTFARHYLPLARDDKKLHAVGERILGNLDILVHEGERMARLINDFLDLTKIEAGKVEWNDRLVRVSDFILHAAHSLRAQFEARPALELRVLVDEALPQLFVDLDRMLQVMINLLSNAAKFTQKGTVTVEAVNVDNDFVEIRVADTGPGIPPEEMTKIFDKFHQLEKRSHGEEIKGTGLGLAICKEIVEHYKGRIWVDSEYGKGSTFKFRIPAAGPPVRETFGKLGRKKTVQPGHDAPLVLAVDDNPGIREYLEQLFADEGFRIVTVADGKSALQKAEEILPHCIVMDLMMPGMDGGETIRRLRENPITKDIPVTVLSAYPSRKTPGEDASITKPVDELRLVQTVRGLIQGGRINGRKCILVPSIKPGGNMLMISAGKLRYIKPEEITTQFSDKFSGTVFLSSPGKQVPETISAISNLNDVLVVILPEEDEKDSP